MKPEALCWLMGLLVLAEGEASDYGEEERIGKAGYCPSFPAGLFQPPCTVECEADSECVGALKCCEFACQYNCTPPSREKPGLCPSPLMKKLYVPDPCATTCAADEDCAGAQKCCETSCGRTCRLPLPEKPGKCPKKRPSTTPSFAPSCLQDQECPGTQKCCFSGSAMHCLQVRLPRPGGRGWAWTGRGGAQ
ncbi:WAP four-disulfide core domain protein 2-like [Heteronotia binoei]|uniref:WAP four-disulfide core domain protein 2-like n=1 Tax=Heteronotia binoei TaxID=13085 RepID=UPI0029307AE7|nr:WAP four-disulfide core domain protein 2-like [Heteronotia binoei]